LRDEGSMQLAGSACTLARERFVSGHEFTRAAKPQDTRALAPEILSPPMWDGHLLSVAVDPELKPIQHCGARCQLKTLEYPPPTCHALIAWPTMKQ
jgi:hypothetical protein